MPHECSVQHMFLVQFKTNDSSRDPKFYTPISVDIWSIIVSSSLMSLLIIELLIKIIFLYIRHDRIRLTCYSWILVLSQWQLPFIANLFIYVAFTVSHDDTLQWSSSSCPLHSRTPSWPGPVMECVAVHVSSADLTIVGPRHKAWVGQQRWSGDRNMRRHTSKERARSDKTPGSAGSREEKCICEICTCGWVCVGCQISRLESHLVLRCWLESGCPT